MELPVERIRDHTPYFNMHRHQALHPYTPPEAVLETFSREFERAYAEGGLSLLTLHPHILANRCRIFNLEQLIDRMKSKGVGKGGIWFATHEEVAKWCRAMLGPP
ncbi:MAG: hypothetical protein RML45_08320 [Acetobacteraceae bacterium]|nr:hypothetical protein [Acetobacteraceae bacterium]